MTKCITITFLIICAWTLKTVRFPATINTFTHLHWKVTTAACVLWTWSAGWQMMISDMVILWSYCKCNVTWAYNEYAVDDMPTTMVTSTKIRRSIIIKDKGKVLPYSLRSVGPGADPSVPAVSPQVTLSNPQQQAAITFRQACGQLPSRKTSPSSDQCQVTLLDDRGTCVNNLPKVATHPCPG